MTPSTLNVVLFAHLIDQVGGAEVATKRLSAQLAGRGHRVTILSTQPIRQFRQQRRLIEQVDGLRVIRLPVWQRSPQTFTAMLAFQARLVFPTYLRGSHVLQMRKLDWNTILLARIARRMGIKTICVPQASGFRGDVATFPAGTVHELQPYDWVSALTPDIQREVIGWGYPASHIGLIPNGVDTDFFCPADTPAFPQSAVFVGQFRPEKRLDILLQAWKQIQTEYPQVKLTLIGGGSNVAEYQQMATGLGISPEFIPISNPKDVRNILQRNAVFVLPGTSEGMSNALLEGMAVGLAPVTSDVPGNRVLITPELNGLCYDSNMPEALAGQLRRLFSDPILQKRLGATAREMVTAQYSLSGVVDEYEALYRWLVQVS